MSRITLKMSLDLEKKQGKTLYSADDLKRMMKKFMVVPYEERISLNADVSVRFRNSGHIMGASLIELWVRSADGVVKIVVTGDMGNENLPLLMPPEIIREADYVVVESTAGPIRRDYFGYAAFGKEIQKTLEMGGSVLLPAFVLDRTQTLIFVIGKLKEQGVIPRETPVYVDSSTAKEITKIYRKYSDNFRPEARKHVSFCGEPLTFPHLYEVSSRQALKMHSRGKPAIYVTSSAMLDHANAPRHLEKMIEDPRNLLAIVGWQAPDSTGWKLQQGARIIRFPIEESRKGGMRIRYVDKAVKMRIKTFDIFSYHADGCQILKWLSNFPKLKGVFVVHGNRDNTLRMAELIASRLGFKASAPGRGDDFTLSAQAQDYERIQIHDICADMEISEK